MPHGNIEHVNITVTDPDRSLHLFEKLLGWKERWRGPSMLGGRTIHVGDEDNYLAIYTNDEVKGGFSKSVPLNHVGLQVDDLDAAEQVVLAAGLKTFSHSDYDPGPRSFYFFDWDGIEFEVVSYE
ncbi:VOC family protein [Altererythrobacter arenosus]|uniref:VOC family protein n=1 Tax=Altererythrobacter arenosus TaxID=3032592 RepID=A0ABY8FRA9_9SPHN|nr:VOC family protein [Altererythrobacter sp. CAU 1644]WFL77549.1 VOC family protein [Altererythrobacter sp. CAU 1644]